LLWSGDAVVLDMAILEVRVESLKVDEIRDIRVSGWTMVAFVKVVRKDLPVEIASNLVSVVELVVVKVEFAVSFLLVDVVEMLLPSHFRGLLSVHVDPDEAIDVDLDVDTEEIVLGFLIAF
jgi:hypothetical protein